MENTRGRTEDEMNKIESGSKEGIRVDRIGLIKGLALTLLRRLPLQERRNWWWPCFVSGPGVLGWDGLWAGYWADKAIGCAHLRI